MRPTETNSRARVPSSSWRWCWPWHRRPSAPGTRMRPRAVSPC